MKMWTVLLLVCAMTTLTYGAAVPEVELVGEEGGPSIQEAAPEEEPDEMAGGFVPASTALNSTSAHRSVYPTNLKEDLDEMAGGLFIQEAALEEESDEMPDGPSIHESNRLMSRGFPFCPSGWSRHNGRCFIYISSPMTWAQAERHCQDLGGNLASVHSHVEYVFVQNMISRITQGFQFAWIGGSDAVEEGTWFWSDGTPFTFAHWDAGQPDNQANSDCMLMNFGDAKKFDDQPCDFEKPFVCAMNM
ncbi:type-2 ice-structuring protein-like isoform X3 [Xyrichtys novacula]|uniref:Type-2 ice-structuring protein-like isoform X3 n=1 Tax=Xyrichtys novacula TaxID=13765 RepID=A0AAV1HM36_XYRNO|nr:type-2 ice-structuring protein-like isoform X3 [Xyrichtys novacula]